MKTKKSFWASLREKVAIIAATVSAIGGLLILLSQLGVLHLSNNKPVTPITVKVEPTTETDRFRGMDRDSLQQNFFDKFNSWEKRIEIAKIWYQSEWRDHYTHSESRDILISFGRNILACVEQGAILFVNGDDDFYPIIYAQEREGYRKDVIVVHLSLLNLNGYRKYTLDRVLLAEKYKTVYDNWAAVDVILNDAKNEKFFAVTTGEEFKDKYRQHLVYEGLVYRYSTNESKIVIDTRITERNMTRLVDYSDILDQEGNPRQDLEPTLQRIVLYDYAIAFFNIGLAYEKEGRVSLSKKYISKALSFDPSLTRFLEK